MVLECAWRLRRRTIRLPQWADDGQDTLTVNSEPINLVFFDEILDHLLERILNLGILRVQVHERELLIAHPAVLDAFLLAVIDPTERVIGFRLLEGDVLRRERGFGHISREGSGEVDGDVDHQEPVKHDERQIVSMAHVVFGNLSQCSHSAIMQRFTECLEIFLVSEVRVEFVDIGDPESSNRSCD